MALGSYDGKKSLLGLLTVQFFGESGIDTGGLREEFLSAFISGIQTNLFEGIQLSGLSPAPHVEAVENGSFKVVGQVMVMSILQEGPPLAFLANWVYHYLCTPDVTAISLIDDDIANPDIRTLVKRVKEVNSKEELQAIFQEDTNMDVIMNTGFTSTISLEKKDTIVRIITLQNTIMRVKAELDQMREGLRLHGCLAMMEEYPSLMEKLFVPGEDYTVTSTFLMNSLTAEYSEPGSTRKLQETAVMAYFNRTDMLKKEKTT
ncbi:uncharacterized protein LOC111342835 [Stylophora pistillata]|uniref:uncharacterized protein LOC111342835 n=1 Tax=Stylophora pistillata TaxID=50429 RepID=UPI000C03F020|nr:uncharacterized protein LOC111342835 [Stylophora pistillata]